MRTILTALRMVWALPNSLIGLCCGLIGLCTGGGGRLRGRTLEFYGGAVTWLLRMLPDGQFILAMTYGHVILGQTAAALDVARAHELVHVRQYELWGPFFLPAYGLASLYMWLTGRRAYRDNPFEREAYDQADCE